MSNSDEAYCYSPFTFRLIRVLDMCQDDVEHNGITTLQGRLREISLDNSKPFDALSYVWEDDPSSLNKGQPVSKYVIIDGKPLEIGNSCFIALQNLRDHHGVRTIWVDAICIDQENDSEKNMQIPLMKEIYGKARKVYIWLGESKAVEKDGISYTSEGALEYLRQTSSGHYTLTDARLSGFPANISAQQIARSFRVLREAAVDRWFPNPAASCSQESLKDLVGRKWFRRMWTIQELAMAEEPFAVCGTKSIRWNRLFWGLVLTRDHKANDRRSDFNAVIKTLHGIQSLWLEITRLEHRQSRHWVWVDKESSWYSCWDKFLGFMERKGKTMLFYEVTLGLFMMLLQLYSRGMPITTCGHFFGPPQAFLFIAGALTSLLTPQKQDQQWEESLQKKIISVLNSCRDQDATKPKDKVYALYGLLESLEIKLPMPKYEDSHSLEATYLGFAKAIITWQGSLEILLEATGPWGNAPSWVPNWSERYMRLPFSDANATGAHTFFQFSNDGRGLEIRGREVGVVVHELEVINRFRSRFWQHVDPSTRTSLVSRAPQEPLDGISALYTWFVIAIEVFGFGREGITEFMRLNIPGDTIYTAGDAREWIDLIFEHYPRGPSGTEDGSTGIHPGHRVLEMLLQNDLLFSIHWEFCQFFASSMTCFILNAAGRFLLGIGPSSIQKKDKVVLLPTLRAPMVARVYESQVGTHELQVVGAALVDDMMDRQFWPEDNSSLETILII